MNATKDGFKDRQLHIEDYRMGIPAEQGKQAGVSAYRRIAETDSTITDLWANSLLELILRGDNLNKAYLQVKRNKGKGGIDGMQVDELLPFLRENQSTIIGQVRNGSYKPNPVRRVEIPKEEKGKTRGLGIPTVVDRVIQQAIEQELMPLYEVQFSDSSYGFRPRRGCHDALRQVQKYVDEGYIYAVGMDLEKFFDTVNHSKLIEVLSRTIKDGRVISLIHKYLNAGVMKDGVFEKTEYGVPQGGPLSPLLANVMLNELDKELERRGHRFVRYADDCVILCRSRKSAERTLENIVPYIEGRLFLKVNRTKTTVSHISRIKYLGYAFYRYQKKCRFRVHPKSVRKMEDNLRILLGRNNGMENKIREQKQKQFVTGWVNYYAMADMKKLMQETDEWMRRKIRAVYWKQWKKVRTRYKMLRGLHLPEWQVHKLANSRKGIWNTAQVLSTALTKQIIVRLGYVSMSDYYQKVCENY